MSRVVLQNVSKWYGLVPAVQNVSLEVEDRELFVLVGPSGCGKTSLLRLIAGLDDVSDGKILIDRRVVNHDAPKSRNIAMVFQNFALYPHMTVFDNMAFGLRMRGYSDEEVSARVRQASDMLELTPLLDRKPNEISGGQRQRVAVGRAIVRKPRVF
ncbi:MAG TPA: ABC transporter ATP-binding protein, partial [Elusimicrobiota bacterium]|nr:ABC transporter ATP-binding protein [Elusimicrobiota bacterium]